MEVDLEEVIFFLNLVVQAVQVVVLKGMVADLVVKVVVHLIMILVLAAAVLEVIAVMVDKVERLLAVEFLAKVAVAEEEVLLPNLVTAKDPKEMVVE